MLRNSTIVPKKKKCKCGCGKEGYIFSHGMIKECYQRKNPTTPIAKFSKKREAEIFGEGESFQNLVNDLDVLTSKIVRIKNARIDGQVSCFVCGVEKHWKNMHNSHYIDRKHMGLRFDIRHNCQVSCPACNNLHNTDKSIYTERLESEFKGITEQLIEQSRTTYKWTIGELKELRQEYQNRLEFLMLKFNK